MRTTEIDHICRCIEEGDGHIGAETEGIVTSRDTYEVVHLIEGEQPTHAVKKWIEEKFSAEKPEIITDAIEPDIPESTLECNPAPVRSPISSAASQRLLVIIVNSVLQSMGGGDAQLLHGASWRPPNTTKDDASRHAPFWKQVYYEHQIGVHGDKVASAAGDHLNLSAPWMGTSDKKEVSKKIIEMTARMRLIAGALSIAMSAASPLHYYANGDCTNMVFETSITPWNSARLGHVWPGRTSMDVASLYRDPVNFRRTLERFAETGELMIGRDIWLLTRAQPGKGENIPSFEETCADHGIDLEGEDERGRVRALLEASFRYGPSDCSNPYRKESQWRVIENWRQDMLRTLIKTPRNRVEVRTLETPPAFKDQTPYEYIKAVQTFLELLFIYLCQNPDFVDNLEYDDINLQAAKDNERKVLLGGLDAKIRWIPNMTSTTPRQTLEMLLKKVEGLSQGLGRNNNLRIIRELVSGTLKPPAERIRSEVAEWYGINVEQRHNPRLLPDDDYLKHLWERNRNAMDVELEQIADDLLEVPGRDRPYLEKLLCVAKQMRTPARTSNCQ
jgi:hypothetical protein